MNSSIETTSLAPLQLIPGYTCAPTPTGINRTPLKRCQNEDVTPEWLQMRDHLLIPTLSPTLSTVEDMTTQEWARVHALEQYTTTIRSHEAAKKEVASAQKKVFMDCEDRSLLVLAYDRYTASEKELDAAKKVWLSFEKKV